MNYTPFRDSLSFLTNTHFSDTIEHEMDVMEEILKNKRYRDRVDQLSDEKLAVIAEDHLKALEEASKGIEDEEPDRVNDLEYLEEIANGMQKLAQKVLELRNKN